MSDQAVRLWQEGWFQSSAEPSGVSTLRDPKVCPITSSCTWLYQHDHTTARQLQSIFESYTVFVQYLSG